MKGFFNGTNFNLTLLYSSNGTDGNATAYREKVYPHTDTLVIAKSFDG